MISFALSLGTWELGQRGRGLGEGASCVGRRSSPRGLLSWAWDPRGSLCFLSRPPGALPHSIMMGKLPLGVVSPYVKMSSGGYTDPLKFYATSYCTAYGEGTFAQQLPPGHWREGRGSL